MSRPDPTLRARFWEWAQTALVAVNLGWTTLCLGGFRAETMVVTSLLTAALLVVHSLALLLEGVGADVNAEGSTEVGRGDRAWAFVLFLAYAALNVALVSPVKWLGWMDWFGWAQALAFFAVTRNGIRSPLPRRVVWGTLFGLGLVAVVLGAYQCFVQPDWLMLDRVQVEQYVGRASGSFGIPNSMGALLLLLLPPAVALTVRRGTTALQRVFFGWVTVVLLIGLGLTISRGAWIGLVLALAAWPLFGRRAWVARLTAAVAILVGISGLFAATFFASPRVRERVTDFIRESGERSRPILWRAAAKMTREHPWAGTGGGSFNVEFERHRPEGFLNEPLWAHNDYLNTLSDYGVIGCFLLFGAVVAVAVTCPRGRELSAMDQRGLADRGTPVLDTPLVRQGQAIGLLAFALQLAVDFHFKIPALAMTAAIVGGFVLQPMESCVGTSGRDLGAVRTARTLWTAALALGIAAVTVVLIVPLYRSEALREDAREEIDALADEPVSSERYGREVAAAREQLRRAVALAPENARAWADLAYASAQWSRLETDNTPVLGREAEADAEHALQLAPTVAEFWIRRGVARDMEGRWEAAGEDFTHAITLAPKVPQPWFHYAYHLSLRPTGLDMARAMVETCLRLDPQNRDGLRLRHQLATGRSRP